VCVVRTGYSHTVFTIGLGKIFGEPLGEEPVEAPGGGVLGGDAGRRHGTKGALRSTALSTVCSASKHRPVYIDLESLFCVELTFTVN
jgi:hypothetical protein